MRNLTHARLIEDWIAEALGLYERITRKPIVLPIPVFDMADRLFNLKVDIESLSGKFSRASGVLFPEKRWVILNDQNSPLRLRFTLAHEIGHLCIDTNGSLPLNNWVAWPFPIASERPAERERLANFFAGVLLMPKGMLLNQVQELREARHLDLQTLSEAFDVSPATMLVRLDEIHDDLIRLGVSVDISEESFFRRRTRPAERQPKWKLTVVKLDGPLFTSDMYRRLSILRSQSEKLYILLTEESFDDVEAALDFEPVDGFLIVSPQYEKDVESTLIDNEGYRYLPLDGCNWFANQSDNPLEDGPHGKTLMFYPRSSDGQLQYEQQDLIDISRFIVPKVRLNNRHDAAEHIKRAKGAGKRVVIATGCFDLVTNAHVKFLRRAKTAGDILVVGLEDDARVRAIKGPYRPVSTISQRTELIDALEFVDFTFVIKGSPKHEMKSFYSNLHADLKANILAVSEGDRNLEERKEEIEAGGGKIMVVSRFEEGSTTSLLRRFLARTEFSDLVYVSKSELKRFVVENQEDWRQSSLPFMPGL